MGMDEMQSVDWYWGLTGNVDKEGRVTGGDRPKKEGRLTRGDRLTG